MSNSGRFTLLGWSSVCLCVSSISSKGYVCFSYFLPFNSSSLGFSSISRFAEKRKIGLLQLFRFFFKAGGGDN